MYYFRSAFFALIGLCFVLAGCQTKPDPATQLALSNYFASAVDVQRTSGFTTGIKTLGDVPAETLADMFSNELEAKLASDLPNYMKGSRQARVVVLLETASIASGVGRVILASDSYVEGTVSIIDAQTGQTLTARRIRAADIAGINSSNINGVPIGAMVSLAVNASNSGTDRRIELAVDAFADETNRWLRAASR